MFLKSVFVLFFLVSFSVNAQEIGLKHFERKIELQEVFLPGDDFNSADYNISFPDSLYKFAEITLKKVKLPTSKVGIDFYVENHSYTSTKIAVKKGRNRDRLLLALEKKLGSQILAKSKQYFKYDGQKIQLSIYNVRRTYFYTFTIEESNGD